jgi:hypothetical protein
MSDFIEINVLVNCTLMGYDDIDQCMLNMPDVMEAYSGGNSSFSINSYEVDPISGNVIVSTFVSGADAAETAEQIQSNPNSFVNVIVEDTDSDGGSTANDTNEGDNGVFLVVCGLALFCLGLFVALVFMKKKVKKENSLKGSSNDPYSVPA